MISVNGLTKTYGSRDVVDDVSFGCVEGTVTGLLGPNGAGKSTTLKMILDLAAATRGSATIGGARYKDLAHPGQTVGVSLDASGLHPGRTVQETLRLAARIIQVPRTRADQIMEEVGLGSHRSKLVRKCSLGMRQRLSIGVALLGDPEYIILDEPVNGLDPGGIAWIRQLLRDKAEAGHTVLLSSHLLREVESIADEVVIMNSGRVVVQGILSELIADESGVVVAASDLDQLRQALDKEQITYRKQGADIYASATPEQVGQLALDHRVRLTKLVTATSDRIESMYFESTSREPVAVGKAVE